MLIRTLTFIGLCALASLPATACGQVRRPASLAPQDSSVASLMRGFRDGRVDIGALGSDLKQLRKVHPRARLDSLADSLTRISVTGSDPARRLEEDPGAKAMIAIAAAGMRDSTGRSYGGALERLTEIHRTATALRTRVLVLNYFLDQEDKPKAAGFLGRVAISSDTTASWAVSALQSGVERRIGAAENELRRIWQQRLITNPRLAGQLEAFATAKGWQR